MNNSSNAVSEPERNPPPQLGPIKTWIVNHDRSLIFALVYVILTIVLSVFISYFWLLALVAVHIMIEWLSKSYRGYRYRLAWTLWDVKLDLALVCLAFALLSYTGINAGVAGAQSATRAGVLGGRLSAAIGSRIGFLAVAGEYLTWIGRYFSRLAPFFSRFGQLLTRFGIKVIDVVFSARVALFRKADMARAAARKRKPPRDCEPTRAEAPTGLPWQRRLSGGDWFAISVIVINLIAVFSAPLITDHSYASLFQSLATKLHPWPN